MKILPPEIIYEILAYSIDLRNPPVLTLMTTCSVFHEICQGILYTALNFTSISQIKSFVNAHKDSSSRSHRLGTYHPPRSVVFDITRYDHHVMFFTIHTLFSECFQQPNTYADGEGADEDSVTNKQSEIVERDEQGKLVLDLLHLRINSHILDSDIEMVYESLSLVNPRSFIWTGRDPPHHFSIAIVPGALDGLFRALSGFTNLTHLKLTHFTTSVFTSASLSPYICPIMPSLRTLYFGQVIYLDPHDICEFILHPRMASLESVELVDAYIESIWGPRLRRSDIEWMITSPPVHDPVFQRRLSHYQELAPFGYWTIGRDPADESPGSGEAKLAFIRRVVVCRAKTERIMGGDRVEENAILV